MNNFFSQNIPIISATAPGRMDVMGGIADYSGSLLLQMPIKQTTTVNIQKRKDGIFKLRTQLSVKKSSEFAIHVSELKDQSPIDAGKIIRSLPGGDWAVYVLGCFVILEKEKEIELTGANIMIESDVPWGKGVSSSAALEIATMNALDRLYNLSLDQKKLPVLAQMAENLVAGAPCGLMDQLSSHLGEKNRLLPLVCQPNEVGKAISIPRNIFFTGIDSGIRHAVSGASYSDVRTAAFMAYTMIALHEGAAVGELTYAKNSGNWNSLPYKGYLANIPVAIFEEKYISLLPDKISGKDFLDQFKVSIDSVTNIDIDRIYKPLVCAQHPLYENERINKFVNLIRNFRKENDKRAALEKMGMMMLQSHKSYSAVGLGNQYTDEIVQMVIDAGAGSNVFGARVSGGGNGGTVVILNYGKEGKEAVKDIYKRHKQKIEKRIFFFEGSSHGALILNK